MPKHFGCDLRTSELYLTRDSYIRGEQEYRFFFEQHLVGSDLFSNMDERVAQKKEEVLLNYDLNMAYYRSLDQKEFDSFANNCIVKNSDFVEVSDLNDYRCSGLYIMVLGNYKQVYVGISENIKRRIQQHWVIHKDLFRLVFGGILDSKLSVDSFRALDTTRIFVCLKNTQSELWKAEDKLVEAFPARYLCNRIGGGDPTEQILDENYKFADLPEVTEENIADILPQYTWEQYVKIIMNATLAFEDRRKYFRTSEELWAEREARWREEQKRREEEEAARQKYYQSVVKEVEHYGFSVEKDFPDAHYRRGEKFNLNTILKYIEKGKEMGADVSFYKGLNTREVAKMFTCLEGGIGEEEARRLAKKYEKVSDVKYYLKKIKCFELREAGISIRKISEELKLTEYEVRKILKNGPIK